MSLISIGTNQSTSSNINNQAFVSQDNIPWGFVEPKPENPNILGVILAFNPARLRILNIILLLCSRYKHVYASQEKIAKMANVHITTANKEIAKLAELGLIAKKYCGANKPCWYKVSEFFNDIDVKQTLKSKLVIFFYFTTALLISAVNADTIRCKNVLRNIYKKEKNCLLPETAYLEEKTQKDTNMSSELTNKLLQKENCSTYILQKCRELNLNQQQTCKLSVYPDGLFKIAYEKAKKADCLNNPDRSYRYIFRVCSMEFDNFAKHKQNGTEFKRNSYNDKSIVFDNKRSAMSKFRASELSPASQQRLIMYKTMKEKEKDSNKGNMDVKKQDLTPKYATECTPFRQKTIEEIKLDIEKTKQNIIEQQNLTFTDFRYFIRNNTMQWLTDHLTNLEEDLRRITFQI